MHSSYAAIDIVAGSKRTQNKPIETQSLKTSFNKKLTKGNGHEQHL